MQEGEPNPAATGLDEDAERVYRLLLAKSDSSVSQLAAEAGCLPARARKILAELVESGFATMVADSRYRAVAPDVVLGQRIAMRLSEVSAGYDALRELLEVHRSGSGRGGRDDRGRWEQAVGAVAIRSRLSQLRDTAEHSIRTFIKPPLILPMPDNGRHRELQARGVRYRHLFARSVLDSETDAAYLRQVLGWSDEIRFAADLPLKMVLVDDRAVMIEEPGPGRPRAIVTANRPIVTVAAALFEHLWLDGIPAAGGEPNGAGIAADDALLLSLLIAGLTDQSIASKLGIGLRTVQRRVRDLMDLAEVDTRIQLGWHAAKHGWVP